ncbi:MAG: proprotein convertase P-domain-containing protein [Phaeodactylibacter sp.]|nr:proprotein convertase P-domain-containing protein [Phaeodactylibacter sp.]
MRIFTRNVVPILAAGALLLAYPTFSQTYPMGNQPLVNTCGGFFTDSGSNTNSYSPNENLTMTICPQSGQGSHVQLVFSNSDIADGDLLCFYDGMNTGAPQLSCSDDFYGANTFIIQATAANPSGCLTITFASDGSVQGEGWSADINCIQACQTILVDLVSSDPTVTPADTGWIDACPGQRITLSGQGIYPQNGVMYNHSDFTSEFVWDFGDGTSAVGPDVSHIYDEPGGYTVQLAITDQQGCKNINFLSQRVRISTLPEFYPGGIPGPLCPGDTIQLTGAIDTILSGASLSVPRFTEGAFQTAGVRSDSLPLPDGTGAVYQTSISFTDFSPGQVLTDIDDLLGICVNMEHSWMYDLDIFLQCPDGTQVTLQNQEFIANEVFLGVPYELDDFNTPFPPGQGVGYNYCWTPNATNGDWTTYAQSHDPGGPVEYTLPPGDYSSYESLGNLLGCPLNGEWTIIVSDQWGSDNGWIFEWSINFAPDIYPNLETFTPQTVDFGWEPNPTILNYSADSLDITVSPENAGTASYNFWITNDFGCTFDTSIAVTVLPHTHPDCYNCAQNLAPVPDTIICAGETVNLDVSQPSAQETQVTFESINQEPFGAATYPPANPFEPAINVNSINPGAITDPLTQIISVCVNIETNWNGDLNLYLEAPSGELLELSTGNGGGSDNYANTCFSPTATTPITSGTGPFTGTYRPEGNWNSLMGAQINGDWKLVASDAFAPNDVGEFISWSITFLSTNDIQYTWTGNGLSCNNCPNPDASPNTSTNYIVTTQDAYGCSYSDTIVVTVVNDIPAPNVQCADDGSGNLIFTWEQVGSFTEYEYNVITNGSPSGWQGPVSQYMFTANNLSYGDEVTLEVRVFVDPSTLSCAQGIGSATCTSLSCLLQASLLGTPVDVSCNGGNEGAASVQAQNAENPVQYYFNGSATPQSNGIFTNLIAGDYYVAVVDGSGCRDTVFFAIQEPAPLAADAQVTTLIDCHGNENGAAQVSPQGGNGGYTYQWSTTPVATTATASGLGAGDYTVTVTDSEGCEVTAMVTLTEPDELEVSLTPEDASCAGLADGNVQAFASGGNGTLSYSWDNGGNGATQSSLLAGNYCVTVTDANGCQATACAEVGAPASIIIDSVSVANVLCQGGNTGNAAVYASGGSGNYTYLWDDPLAQIGQSATMLVAGTYTITITDANGCQATTQAEVNEPEALSLSFDEDDVACTGGNDGVSTATANGGITPYTYLWQGGQTGPIATGLAAGTYGLTVTDHNGCQESATSTITEPEKAVDAEAVQSRMGCFGEKDNEATVMATGGTGSSYTYHWSNGQTAATAIGLDSIPYTVTVTDVNGCEAVASITPSDLEQIDFFIITTTPSCNGYTDGRLGINEISGGAGTAIQDYTIVWSTGAAGPTVNNLAGGQSYSVTVTDNQGCTRTKARNLQQPQLITFQLDVDSVSCFGGSDGAITASNVDGEHAPFTYNWNDGQQDATASNLSAGNYGVTVTDATGCFNTSTATVYQPTALALSFEAEDNKCYGEKAGRITASASGGIPGYQYSWSNSSSSSALENLAAGVYSLTITDRNGCTLEGEAAIEEPDLLAAALKKEDPTCYGFRDGSITVDASGGTPPYRYSLDNSFFSGSSMLIALKGGSYDVYLKDANGCLYTEEITLTDPAPFTVDAGDDSYTIELGDSIMLNAAAQNAVGLVDFVWEAPYEGNLSCTECISTMATPETSILYQLYGIDENGCEDTDKVHVYVKKERVVMVPTGFTPNGDGHNDMLTVHGKNGTAVKRFQIFDRWGELLFQNGGFAVNDASAGWDGNYRGQPANGGVYVWYLIVEYQDGMQEAFRGETTLIR